MSSRFALKAFSYSGAPQQPSLYMMLMSTDCMPLMSTEREYPARAHLRTHLAFARPPLPHAPGCSVVVATATALPQPGRPLEIVVRRSSGRLARLAHVWSPTSTRHAACTEARGPRQRHPVACVCVCVCVCVCMHAQVATSGIALGTDRTFYFIIIAHVNVPKAVPKAVPANTTCDLRSYTTKADSGLPSSLPSTCTLHLYLRHL